MSSARRAALNAVNAAGLNAVNAAGLNVEQLLMLLISLSARDGALSCPYHVILSWCCNFLLSFLRHRLTT